MAHKNDFIRFVDKRITKNNDNILYSGNVQFETIIKPVNGNRSILYKLLVNHLGVSKYYQERRDTNFLRFFDFFKFLPGERIYTCILEKNTSCVYISRDDLD